MFFPEELWRQYLSEKPVIPTVMPRITGTTVAAASVTVGYQVPLEYDGIITNLVARTGAGGAQTTTSIALRALHSDGSTPIIAMKYNVTTANAELNWTGQLYVTRACTIQAVGAFSAGAVANIVDLSLWVMLVPKSYILS